MITRALAADDDGAPSATAAAAAFRAARETIGAERSEILAHKCHEALKTLGPGGVAVAVVGSEHVSAIGRQFGKTDPKRVEQLLAGPPVSDSLIAVAAPTVAVGAPLALGHALLPPLPKRGMWLAWAVLPAVYEMYIVRGGCAPSTAYRGGRGGPGGPRGHGCSVYSRAPMLLGRVVRERTIDVLLLRLRNPAPVESASIQVVVLTRSKARRVPRRVALRAIQTPDRPRDPARQELALEAVLGVGVREVPICHRQHQVPTRVGRNNTLGDVAEEPDKFVGAHGYSKATFCVYNNPAPSLAKTWCAIFQHHTLTSSSPRKRRTSRSPDAVAVMIGSCASETGQRFLSSGDERGPLTIDESALSVASSTALLRPTTAIGSDASTSSISLKGFGRSRSSACAEKASRSSAPARCAALKSLSCALIRASSRIKRS